MKASSGILVNQNGGFYRPGVAYTLDVKIRIAMVYEELKEEAAITGKPPVSKRQLAVAASVSPEYAGKIMDEVDSGGIVDPATVDPERERGPGSMTLDLEDELLLLRLHQWKPSMRLSQYCMYLRVQRGTIVSESTISRWFLTRFPFKGSFRKPNLVPIDKFKPNNILRAKDYIDFVKNIDPFRLKFGDEKHLKGSELFCTKGRRNPLTGEIPSVSTSSDFRNTYSIIGFCGIDPRTLPMSYVINEMSNDSNDFSFAVEDAIATGFLQRWDVLVLDNASIHIAGENDVLQDWLWNAPSPWDGQPLRILLVLLPPRAPELNPIELLWQLLVKRLKLLELEGLRAFAHAPAIAAASIMKAFTFNDVGKNYKKCGYFASNVVFD